MTTTETEPEIPLIRKVKCPAKCSNPKAFLALARNIVFIIFPTIGYFIHRVYPHAHYQCPFSFVHGIQKCLLLHGVCSDCAAVKIKIDTGESADNTGVTINRP